MTGKANELTTRAGSTQGNKATTLSVDLASSSIDLSDLSPEKRAELIEYAAKKRIDLEASMLEVKRDILLTSTGMNNVADVVRKMAESGDSVTLRQTINNSAGKVELVGGNTDEAKKGVTTPPIDRTWMYVAAGIAAAILVAMILSK